jgi:DNA/RNA-binding domain of Phe-tRNA-synthetase-like protein
MKSATEVRLSPGLGKHLQLAAAQFEDVDLSRDRSQLQTELDGVCDSLRKRYRGAAWLEIPGVAETRALYKAIGLDPTKVRPSSEALLRRVLKGQALYRVNLLVDAVNLCSLDFQLSYGLYDLGQLTPPLDARIGRPGENYPGIRKGPVHLEGRICLADATGPFGNPSSDSARAAITEDTRTALVVVFAPAGLAKESLAERLDQTVERVARLTGARHVSSSD